MNSKIANILLVFTILLIFSVVSRIFFNDFQDGWNAYEKKDYKTARELWLPLAEQGEPKAQFFLGFMYDFGQGVPEDNEEAVKWYQLAAGLGDSRAQLFTGFMYDFGQGVPEDDQKAIKWYQLASGQGFKQAKKNIYELAKKNSTEALKIVLIDAKNGSAEAQIALDAMREMKLVTLQDTKKSLTQDQISEKRISEDLEYAQVGKTMLHLVSLNNKKPINKIIGGAKVMTEARYTFGMMYAEGQEGRQGKNKELKWYKAAEYSAEINKYNLAKNNVVQALQDLKIDAEKGVVEAQFILATMYANGRGVPQDNKKAFKWFYRVAKEKRAALGDVAVNNFDRKNIPQEIKFLTLDAENGIAEAQYNLGMEYTHGKHLLHDDEQAFKWYRLASEQGNSMAQYNLGVMYLNGTGVLASEEEAMKWFRLYLGQTIIKLGQTTMQGQVNIYSLAKRNVEAALEILVDDARSGTATAQHYLGDLYRDGIGVLPDSGRAYMWYTLASLQGNKSARGQKESLVKKMSLKQIKQAQKYVRDWKPRK
jgi:uncharacterized protein